MTRQTKVRANTHSLHEVYLQSLHRPICSCQHKRAGLNPVVSGRMYTLSLNPVTKSLFVQINILQVWYLTLCRPESTWIQAADLKGHTKMPAGFPNAWQAMCHSKTCLLLWELIKPCICRAKMSSTLIVVSIQMHSKQQVTEEQACCRLALLQRPLRLILARMPPGVFHSQDTGSD